MEKYFTTYKIREFKEIDLLIQDFDIVENDNNKVEYKKNYYLTPGNEALFFGSAFLEGSELIKTFYKNFVFDYPTELVVKNTYDRIIEDRNQGIEQSFVNNVFSEFHVLITSKHEAVLNETNLASLIANSLTLNDTKLGKYNNLESKFTDNLNFFKEMQLIDTYDNYLSSERQFLTGNDVDHGGEITRNIIFDSQRDLVENQFPAIPDEEVFRTFPTKLEYLGVDGDILDSDELNDNSSYFGFYNDGSFYIKAHQKGYLKDYEYNQIHTPKEAIVVPLKFRLTGADGFKCIQTLNVSVSFNTTMT